MTKIFRVFDAKDTPHNGSLNFFDTEDEATAQMVTFLLNNTSRQGDRWVYCEVEEDD